MKTEDFQAEGNVDQGLENGDGTFGDDVGDTQCVEDAQTNLLSVCSLFQIRSDQEVGCEIEPLLWQWMEIPIGMDGP